MAVEAETVFISEEGGMLGYRGKGALRREEGRGSLAMSECE